MTQKRVLFVFTSADKLLDGRATGWYLPEGEYEDSTRSNRGSSSIFHFKNLYLIVVDTLQPPILSMPSGTT